MTNGGLGVTVFIVADLLSVAVAIFTAPIITNRHHHKKGFTEAAARAFTLHRIQEPRQHMHEYSAPHIKKINNIQALRGLAIVMVVLFHTMLNERRYGLPDWILPEFFKAGAAGVDLFFVISGFIITTVAKGRFQQAGAIKDFVWNRVTRIYPLFCFYALIFLLSFYLISKVMAVTTSFGSSYDIASSFLLLPQRFFSPILPVRWTLVHEVYFYLVFTFFLFLPERHLLKCLMLFLFLVVIGNLIFEYETTWRHPWLTLYTNPLTVEFIAGCAVAILIHRRGVARYGLAALTAGGLGLIAVIVFFFMIMSREVPEGWTRIFLFGVPSTFMVYGAVAMEVRDARNFSTLLGRLGDASYSIYLTHLQALTIVGFACSRLKVNALKNNLVIIFIMLASTLICGFLSYRFIERPLLSASKKAKKLIV